MSTRVRHHIQLDTAEVFEFDDGRLFEKAYEGAEPRWIIHEKDLILRLVRQIEELGGGQEE